MSKVPICSSNFRGESQPRRTLKGLSTALVKSNTTKSQSRKCLSIILDAFFGSSVYWPHKSSNTATVLRSGENLVILGILSDGILLNVTSSRYYFGAFAKI
ncbi:hypothetical protein Glove_426g3 [Diversispora epigaea]|uniref:Uncharacterized protein n=1 Tax=Diversispora epigaea TaxID=1348612 RepID=A0A397GUR3_9GLOM|nr:hypothetical protein Glove_426g3 [Diversispora epigaea]